VDAPVSFQAGACPSRAELQSSHTLQGLMGIESEEREACHPTWGSAGPEERCARGGAGIPSAVGRAPSCGQAGPGSGVRWSWIRHRRRGGDPTVRGFGAACPALICLQGHILFRDILSGCSILDTSAYPLYLLCAFLRVLAFICVMQLINHVYIVYGILFLGRNNKIKIKICGLVYLLLSSIVVRFEILGGRSCNRCCVEESKVLRR
jgi:hypothetical protein